MAERYSHTICWLKSEALKWSKASWNDTKAEQVLTEQSGGSFNFGVIEATSSHSSSTAKEAFLVGYKDIDKTY